MRLIAPLLAFLILLAGCSAESASPPKPAQNPTPAVTAGGEKPNSNPVPVVNPGVPKDAPAQAGQTVAYEVEGMH